MSNRTEELKLKRQAHQLAITELNHWLLGHFNHPDRAKVFSDRAWHECEINRIDAKLHNIKAGLPEHGFSADMEQNNLNRNIINQIQ